MGEDISVRTITIQCELCGTQSRLYAPVEVELVLVGIRCRTCWHEIVGRIADEKARAAAEASREVIAAPDWYHSLEGRG